MQGRQSLMAQLSGLQTLFLFAPVLLLAIALSSGSACPDG
jgi:methyl-accepting chemotaxis protein-1 (serine sensor receptor)